MIIKQNYHQLLTAVSNCWSLTILAGFPGPDRPHCDFSGMVQLPGMVLGTLGQQNAVYVRMSTQFQVNIPAVDVEKRERNYQ